MDLIKINQKRKTQKFWWSFKPPTNQIKRVIVKMCLSPPVHNTFAANTMVFKDNNFGGGGYCILTLTHLNVVFKYKSKWKHVVGFSMSLEAQYRKCVVAFDCSHSWVYAMKCLTILVFKRKPFVFIQLPSCSVNFHKYSTPHKLLPTPDLWRKP